MPACRHQTKEFQTGARRGLGRIWWRACEREATHDPDAEGKPTACYAHSSAAKAVNEARRKERYDAFLADLEKHKERNRRKVK